MAPDKPAIIPETPAEAEATAGATDLGSAAAQTEPMSKEDIFDAFSMLGSPMPREAIGAAVARWSEVAPELMARLEGFADGTDTSVETADLLVFTLFLAAKQRDTRAYRPLCKLMLDGERVDDILGDVSTEYLPVMLSRMYDGDPGPVRSVVESEQADQFMRASALGAIGAMTVAGKIDREETIRYLRELHATLRPRDSNHVWWAWQDIVATFALDDFVPLVEEAFRCGWIDPDIMGPGDFRLELQAAKDAIASGDVPVPSDWDESKMDDVVAQLEDWDCFKDDLEVDEDDKEFDISGFPLLNASSAPVRNPYRDVGRNDPCPCGSGLKFKKCCLDKVKATSLISPDLSRL